MEKVDFKINVNGAEIACSYEVTGEGVKVITVVTPFGAETTGLGGLPTDILAARIATKLALRTVAAEPDKFRR